MEFELCIRYIFTLLLCFLYVEVEGLRFNLASNQKKCLREEIHKNILVTGEYEVQDNGQRVDLLVTDLRSHTLYSKENAIKGRFAFTTDEYDQYEVCFTSKAMGGIAAEREVFLNIKHGVEAKSYEDIAKAEKLKPLEVELRRLEDLSLSIVEDFLYMRDREKEMRDTNESTHSLVLYFSIFSMICLLGLATWQVLYLRRYFKSKKLIE